MVKRAKCIIVLSGGPDSAVVAYWAKNKGYDVYGLTFNYGQISIKEIGCARKIAAKLSIPIKIIDLSSLKDIFAGVTSLVDENIQMTTDFSQPIIVPFRNAIFLSVAVAYAISINSKYIFYGAQGSDAQHYPDCRKEFYNSFEQTARLGTNEELEIEAPFSNVPKSETIKLGTKLGVPFHLTWSCYLNLAKHCGKCESCINRKNAFKQSGLTDPTEYIE
ncbi:MAG: 7-cyano-7-deazaguanine synthase QueC [Candidatus Bathyarchaeota archaeon]|nr:7-cyano-7-deazaguanine synthase QueC [Candidatus Bathyarchaeota archaeon]